jgi:hypothetical protein
MKLGRSARDALAAAALHAYPRTWRERYGDELLDVIVQQTAESGRARRSRIWFNVVRSGTALRLRGTSVGVDAVELQRRGRTGLFAVICAWTAFVFAGMVLAKSSEHWSLAIPAASGHLADLAMGILIGAAVVVGSVLIAGIAVAIPTTLRQTRGATLRLIKWQLSTAVLCTVFFCGYMSALVVWANRLSEPARNGIDTPYSFAVVGAALALAATLAAWCCAGIALGRHVTLSPQLQAVETAIAAVAALGMVVMTLSAAAWWLLVSRAAAGAPALTVIDPLVFAGVLTLMGISAALSCAGSFAAIRSVRALAG